MFTIDQHQTVIKNQTLIRIEIIIAKTVTILQGINQAMQNQAMQSQAMQNQVINLLKIVTITDQTTIKMAETKTEINVKM